MYLSFFIFIFIILTTFPLNEISKVVQSFGQVIGFTSEYSTFYFVYIPKPEIEGLLQFTGDMGQG